MWSVQWTAIFIIIFFGTCLLCESSKTPRQERALIKYSNPAYLSNVTVFTGRTRRNAPYMTNLTGILLAPADDNVSISLGFQWKSGSDFKLTYTVCESVKLKWARAFLKEYTNIPASCPLPAGPYHMLNMELPPKNLPVPIPDGDYHVIMTLFLTDNPKEIILLTTVLLRYEHSMLRG